MTFVHTLCADHGKARRAIWQRRTGQFGRGGRAGGVWRAGRVWRCCAAPDYARNKLVCQAGPSQVRVEQQAAQLAGRGLTCRPSSRPFRATGHLAAATQGGRNNHFSQRLLTRWPLLFITSGERFKFTVAQDLNLSKSSALRPRAFPPTTPSLLAARSS